jgi:DNA-binding CsgD family transcriptional regulator
VSAVPPAAPLTGRAALAASIASSLATAPGRGALIVGASGMGRTTILREALSHLGVQTASIGVRGVAGFRDAAYGALSYLLTELETADLDSPALVLAALRRRVEETSPAGPPVVIVENADELDAFSAVMLAELARSGAVRLLVTSEDLRAVPAELTTLWRSGDLARFDLAPLSVEEVDAMLTAALGSEASPSAVQRLWEASCGNPQYLQALTDDQLESGNLVDEGGCWCLADPDLRPGRLSLEIAHARLAPLPSAHRDALEMLSATGESALEDLVDAVGPATVGALEDAGWIEVERGTPPVVKVADPFLEKVLRSSPVGSRRRHPGTLVPPASPARAVADTGSTPAGTTASPALRPARPTPRRERAAVRRLLGACRQSVTRARTGRALEGVELAEIALADLDPARTSAAVTQLAHASLFTSSLFAGKWVECHERLASLKDSNWSDSAIDASIADLGRGLLYALGGQPTRALTFLTPALTQLRTWGMTHHVGLGSAVEAYSRALLGESARARGALETAQHARGPDLPRAIERPLLYFMALATAHLTSKDWAIEQLMIQYDDAVRREAVSEELLLLSTIVRFGRTSLAERLAQRAATAQGTFAELCRLYGIGVSTGAGEPLLEAATLAASFGNDLFSADAARAALDLAQPNRENARAAKRILFDRSQHSGAAPPGSGHLARLTSRELEIARLAAQGATNRDIAAAQSVSVRTVEGHLYRSLSKLHLASRKDLQSLLAHSSPVAS